MSLLAVAVYWIVLFTSFDSQGASLSDEVPHLLHAIEGSERVLLW